MTSHFVTGHDLTVFERRFYSKGITTIAGLDEVGRGCLAGPVVAAAVILPKMRKSLPGVNDSKKLSPGQREKAYKEIIKRALAWGVGFVEAGEIDQINIFNASKKAMLQALSRLSIQPEQLLIDGNFGLATDCPQLSIIKGDGLSVSIAAASIVAKVTRDHFMTEIQKDYPQFSFAKHKGYGTKLHQDEMARHGLTPLHRRSFGPCSQLALKF